jgi:hypothetical protein
MAIRSVRVAVCVTALVSSASVACKSRQFNEEQASNKSTMVQMNDYGSRYVWVNEVATGRVAGEDSYLCFCASHKKELSISLRSRSEKDLSITENAAVFSQHFETMKPLHEWAKRSAFPPVSAQLVKNALEHRQRMRSLERDSTLFAFATGWSAMPAVIGLGWTGTPLALVTLYTAASANEARRSAQSTRITKQELAKLMADGLNDQITEKVEMDVEDRISKKDRTFVPAETSRRAEDWSEPVTNLLIQAVTAAEKEMHADYFRKKNAIAHAHGSGSPYGQILESVYGPSENGKSRVPIVAEIGLVDQLQDKNPCAQPFKYASNLVFDDRFTETEGRQFDSE